VKRFPSILNTFFIRFGFSVILVSLLYVMASGQAVRRVNLGAGIQLAAERDFGYSPLAFSGAGVFGSASFSREREEKTDIVNMFYTSASLSNRYGSGMGIHSAGIVVFHFYHAGKDAESGLHLGWSNINEFSVRDNEAVNNFNHRFDYFTSFGPAARQRLPFTVFNRSFTFETLFHVQLLGFVIQSSYVSQSPGGFEVETAGGLDVFRRSADWFVPGKAWNMGLWPTLTYRTGTGNLLSIGYRYGFTRLEGAHRVSKSRGYWSVGIHAGI
jgi:hypothetical protein